MILFDRLPEGPQAGIVIGRFDGGYLVRTGSGRTLRATAHDTWIIGTPVTVLAGQILGRAGRPQPSKIYEV